METILFIIVTAIIIGTLGLWYISEKNDPGGYPDC